jgi:hypothetical protein
MVKRQNRRMAAFALEANSDALRRALAPLLEAPSSKTVTRNLSQESVLIVCPAFDLEPDSPLPRAARALADQLHAGGVQAPILTLKARAWPQGLGPDVRREGHLEVRSFSPELPMPAGVSADAHRSLPLSSSLETAVLSSSARVVLFGSDEAVCRHLHLRLPGRASMANGTASVESLARELGQVDPKEGRLRAS